MSSDDEDLLNFTDIHTIISSKKSSTISSAAAKTKDTRAPSSQPITISPSSSPPKSSGWISVDKKKNAQFAIPTTPTKLALQGDASLKKAAPATHDDSIESPGILKSTKNKPKPDHSSSSPITKSEKAGAKVGSPNKSVLSIFLILCIYFN